MEDDLGYLGRKKSANQKIGAFYVSLEDKRAPQYNPRRLVRGGVKRILRALGAATSPRPGKPRR